MTRDEAIARLASGDNPQSIAMRDLINDIYGTQLVFPLNREVLFIGDSRTNQGSVWTATERTKLSQGFITWLQYLTHQRFDVDIENDNFGVSSDTTALIRARAESAFKISPAGTVVYLGGTNDANASIAPATTIDNISAVITAARNAGRVVVLVMELPRGEANFTSARLSAANLRKHHQVRDWMRSLRIPGVYVVDPWPLLADLSATNGDATGTMFKDGLHPNETGAYWIAKALQPLFEYLFPLSPIVEYSNGSLYDATDNPYGVLNANPLFTGTGGTKTTDGSGNLGDSWSESTPTPACTRVYSQEAGGWQKVVFGGTATGTSISVRQVITSGNLAIGDRVQASCEFEILADQSNMVAAALVLLDNNSIRTSDMRPTANTARVPNLALSGTLRTPIATLTSTTLQLQIEFQFIAAAVAGSFRFRRCALRKVRA